MFSTRHLTAGKALRPLSTSGTLLFASVPDELRAGVFHDAGSDREPTLPAKVAGHSAQIDLLVADADRNGFGRPAVSSKIPSNSGRQGPNP